MFDHTNYRDCARVSTPSIKVWDDQPTTGREDDRAPPRGSVEVSLYEISLPGVYGKFKGKYYQIDTSDKWEYIAFRCRYHNQRRTRWYILECEEENRHLGVALLYNDNCHTGLVRLKHTNTKPSAGFPRNQWPKPSVFNDLMQEWNNTPMADFWFAKLNRYDDGYPEGPPLEELDLYEGLEEPNTTPLIPELYDEFEYAMAEFMASPYEPVVRAGATKKVGVCTPATIVKTIDYRHALRDSEAFEAARKDLTTGIAAVACLPKIGHLTSDGKIRRVFPMSPSLQIALQNVIGKRSPEYAFVKRITGATFPPMRNTYDVIKCDYAIYPYLRRWVDMHAPHLMRAIFPPILTPKGPVEPQQLLSGIFGTNHFGEAFAVAIARLSFQLGAFIYVQGDGVSTDCDVEPSGPAAHLLRKNPPYTINGFEYSTGVPRYTRAVERLSSPRLLKVRSINGHKGWCFRREVYRRFLNPTELPPPGKFDFSTLTDRELLDMCWNHHMCLRKLRYTGIIEANPAESHWHYANTKPRLIHHELPIIDSSRWSPLWSSPPSCV